MGDYTIQEVVSQPEMWRRTLDFIEGAGNILQGDGPLLFTGCGSSYFLSLAAAACWSGVTGRRAFAVSATDLLTYPECHFPPGAPGAAIVVSRSGKTMETLEASRHLKAALGWRVVGATSRPGSALLELCDSALVLAETAENSRFTTRVFTCTLLAFQVLAADAARNTKLRAELSRLPDLGERLLQRQGAWIKDLALSGNFSQYVYLGHGPYYGLACESMLKTKEMARTPAEAYHSLEYMHGPRYAATPSTLMTVLLSDGGAAHQLQLLAKLKGLGVQTAAVCERASSEVTGSTDFVLELNSGLSDYGRLLLLMPLMQLFAYHRACVLGISLD